jgi:hypothetical protein
MLIDWLITFLLLIMLPIHLLQPRLSYKAQFNVGKKISMKLQFQTNNKILELVIHGCFSFHNNNWLLVSCEKLSYKVIFG